jgi:hypothetical protein
MIERGPKTAKTNWNYRQYIEATLVLYGGNYYAETRMQIKQCK